MNEFKLNRSLRRAGWLASTALLFAGAQVAHAESPIGKIAATQPEAQSSAGKIDATEPEAQTGPKIVAIDADPQIVIANPGTPTTARDTTNITGVGQMVIDQGDGFIGLCTGTLINPRTVILAAHCVNSRPATDYGNASGGTPIMFGFEANLRRETTGAPDELVQWLLAGPLKGKTNVASSLYNVNQVAYNNFSLEEAARSFLYGDVALATLDTPAANIPTWALLFSPLPDPGAIGAAGTGYNVAITGYGRNGNATTGSGSIDYRRRSAENMIGALTDLDTFEQFLFGEPPTGLKQNLYFLDFDDPLRGTPGASIFDFNAFRDPARIKDGTPSEGTTASGDSGGPLILQNFAKQVVIGVLSGGYTRFFNGQPANGYGTVSFYQPLYLYWDWIAANNPYHYVSAKAGDGQWTDANHWLTTLDPAYMILSGGSLVNGVPTAPGEQKNGTSGDFGQACFESAAFDSYDCQDLATGAAVNTRPPAATADNNAATVAIAENNADTQRIETRVFSEVMLEAQAETSTPVLPAATLANGLPGATGFVPSNVDPVRATGARAQYYDVTLTANGTTTLSGANVTIDRLTIGTAGANLVVANGASLTTLMGTTQFAGTNTVNGTFTSVGDYSLLGGALLGSGRINAPFVTSVMGQIIPGTASSIGTLTVGGNLIMASGTGYLVNLGPNGTSDRISVVANGSSTGAANIGGALGISPLAGTTVRYGDRYTILSAEGGVTGTFSTPAALSAILRPTAIYSTNAVQLRIDAGSYASVVSTSSPVQVAYAQLLDANRTVGGMPGLYDVLDLQSAGTIRTVLDSLAPRTETLRSAMGTVALDNNSRLIRQRLITQQPGSLGGTVAYVGRPMQTLASVSNLNRGIQHFQGPDGGMTETRTAEGRLPETMSGFLAGGYLDGESRPMATALPLGGNDQFDGWYLAGGLEGEIGNKGLIGFALSYTDIDGKTGVGGGTVKGQLFQGTLYLKQSLGVLYADAQISAGLYRTDASRDGSLPGNTYRLNSKDDVLAFSSEFNIGAEFGDTIKFGPRAGLRTGWMDFGRSLETGGPTALVYDRFESKSVQGRAGFVLNGVGKIRPTASVNYVHEFKDQPTTLAARFVGGLAGVNPGFALTGFDKDWFEASAGITLDTGKVDLSLSADTTIGRDDVKNQAYRASVAIRF